MWRFLIRALEINDKTTLAMSENEEMIVATSDIAFAVKKDGSTIIGKDNDPTTFIRLYKALTEYALKCDEVELVGLAFTEMLGSQMLHSVIEKRVMSLEKNKE